MFLMSANTLWANNRLNKIKILTIAATPLLFLLVCLATAFLLSCEPANSVHALADHQTIQWLNLVLTTPQNLCRASLLDISSAAVNTLLCPCALILLDQPSSIKQTETL